MQRVPVVPRRPRRAVGDLTTYPALVGVNDPLSRLLRLRGQLAESLPDGEVQASDAVGLAGTYERLRPVVRDIANDVGANLEEFDHQFPESTGGRPTTPVIGLQAARAAAHNQTVARTAATLLRQLGGYAGGLIEAIALTQNLSAQQIEVAREAARSPLGVR